MAAMRLFPPLELEEALKSLGCVKTDTKTETSSFWYTSNGTMFSVPEPDGVSGKHSDFIYYQIMQFARDH